MKRILRDNRGLSLMELIVAVAILAAVVSPLLHTFVTSARTAAKSAQLGDATAAAQNVQELLESTHMDELSDSLRRGTTGGLFGADSVTVTGGSDDGQSGYEFRLNGLSSGGSTFDAVVTMDAAEFDEQNTVEVTQYTPMGVVFSQFRDETLNPDLLACVDFAAEAAAVGRTDLDTAMKYYEARLLEREMTITITESSGRINVDILFEYKTSFDYVESVKNPETGETEDVRRTKNLTYESRDWASGSSSVELPSIYFFYYPNYPSTFTPYDDTITINNKDNKELSVFLVKQDSFIEGWDTAHDALYQASITLVESGEAGGVANAEVFSNIDPKKLAFYLDWGSEAYVGVIQLSGDLVAVQAENRMYGVTIALYKPGETAEPVYTLTATKLD